MIRPKLFRVVLALTSVAVIALAVVAFSLGVVASPTPTTVTGASVTAVKVVRERGSSASTASSSTSINWQDIPGAVTTIGVPADTAAFIMARFSGRSSCGGGGSGVCSIRILIRRGTQSFVQMEPAASLETGFFIGRVNEEGNVSLDRSSNALTSGLYTIKVQYGGSSSTQLKISHWSFTVERVKR
jgi:hypothetical protein